MDERQLLIAIVVMDRITHPIFHIGAYLEQLEVSRVCIINDGQIKQQKKFTFRIIDEVHIRVQISLTFDIGRMEVGSIILKTIHYIHHHLLIIWPAIFHKKTSFVSA